MLRASQGNPLVGALAGSKFVMNPVGMRNSKDFLNIDRGCWALFGAELASGDRESQAIGD